MFDRLADQHPVEGVLVQWRQARQMQRASFVERETSESVPMPLPRHQRLGGFRQR